jgi:single-strand DNA-binding protein
MANLNKVMLIGTITRDPEIKYTPKGTAIAAFGIAINHTYTTNGEKREDVTFVDLEAYGRVAEVIGEYCKKGKQLFIEGRLKLDTWDDKQSGQKRSKMKVVADNIQLLSSGEKRESAESGKVNLKGAKNRPHVDLGEPDNAPDDSSIPF